MAIKEIYENGGLVVIQDDEYGESCITWREAVERCQALKLAELRVKDKYERTANVQQLIEQMLSAAVAARCKAEPAWEPPASLLGFSLRRRASIIAD